MKRFLALILACLLLCAPVLAETTAPDAISAEAAPICGVWTLTSLVTGGVAINPALYGMTMTLTFNTDGTFSSDNGQQTTTAAWQAANGVITAGNATLTRLEDGTLSLASGSNTMIFTQTERFDVHIAPTPVPTPVPTETPAPTLSPSDAQAPFCGVWTLTSLISGGTALNPALYGLTMTLTFNADGTFSSDNGQQITTAAWQVANGVITAGNATLTPGEDGTLSLVSGSNTMIFTQTERFTAIAEDTAEPVLTPAPTPAPTATLSPEDARAPFIGAWSLSSVINSGVTLNPALYGMTMTLTFNADGSFVSDDGKQATTASWQVADGVITAGNATLTPGEDGALTLVSGSNTMIFTRPQAVATPTPAPAATPAPTPLLPEDMQPFAGVWHLCYVHHDDIFEGLYGDLRALSVIGTLTLNEDRIARLKVLMDDITYLDESSAWLSGGDAMYFVATLAPMTLLDSPDGPFLRYGTETDYLIFHRSEDAVWTPQTDTAVAVSILYDVPYVAISYSTLGMTISVSEEESLTFIIKNDGTCTLSMYGMSFTGTYTQQADGSYAGSFLGDSFTFTPTATGLDLYMPPMDTTYSLVANPAQP